MFDVVVQDDVGEHQFHLMGHEPSTGTADRQRAFCLQKKKKVSSGDTYQEFFL